MPHNFAFSQLPQLFSPGHGSGIRLLYGRHEKRGVGEQVIHFLEWAFGSFRKDDLEEYSVCQVTNLTFTVSESNDTFCVGDRLTMKRK